MQFVDSRFVGSMNILIFILLIEDDSGENVSCTVLLLTNETLNNYLHVFIFDKYLLANFLLMVSDSDKYFSDHPSRSFS